VAATGRSLSEWQRQQGSGPALNAAVILLLPPREALYAGCDARVERMIEAGAMAEAGALLARRLPSSLPAMKAVGIRELGALLAGRGSHAEAVAAMQQATRQYAKRQYTWFRRRLPEGDRLRKLVLDEQFSESLLPRIFSFIRQFLLTESP
jgi:tRNA dimethylallyltransferase